MAVESGCPGSCAARTPAAPVSHSARPHRQARDAGNLYASVQTATPSTGQIYGFNEAARSLAFASESDMNTPNPITSFLTMPLILAGLAVGYWVNEPLSLVIFVAAVIVSVCLKMVNVWQKFVVLRIGDLRFDSGQPDPLSSGAGSRAGEQGTARAYPAARGRTAAGRECCAIAASPVPGPTRMIACDGPDSAHYAAAF